MPRYTDDDSEIYENFVKLAAEKSLVSKAKSHEYRSPKEIADLHGVKPDMIPGMKYDKNILEVSHPDTFVVLPTQDKINGLLENITERHNILVNIVQKRNHGNLNTRKLAQDQLMKSLIKVANDLDNRDAEELRVLADACLEDLTKQADMWDKVKDFFGAGGGNVIDTGKGFGGGAAIGAVIGGIVGGFTGTALGPAGTMAGVWAGAQAGGALGALVGGLTASIAKTSPHASSVANNSEIAINQLADLIKKFPNVELLSQLNKDLNKLKVYAEQYAQISGNPNAKVTNTDSIEGFTKAYVAQMSKITPLIELFKTKASQGDFAAHESSAWSKLKTPLYWFEDDDVDDVIKALEVLESQIVQAKEGMIKIKDGTHAVVEQAKAQQSSTNEDEGETPEAMLAYFKKKFPGVA